MRSYREAFGELLSLLGDGIEARLFLTRAAGITLDEYLLRRSEPVPDEVWDRAQGFANERLKGVCAAYILGEREFYGHRFMVNPSVLVPQPDTETLVERGVSYLKERLASGSVRSGDEPFKVLDLCTGSGCVGISIALEVPGVHVTFSDISPEALEVAKANAKALGVEGEFVEGSLYEMIAGKFDLIVSNPPYLTLEDIKNAPPEVQGEPHSALFGGGEDGLDLLRKLIENSHIYIKDGGLLALECDSKQTAGVRCLLRRAGFRDIGTDKDLAGLERVVWGIG